MCFSDTEPLREVIASTVIVLSFYGCLKPKLIRPCVRTEDIETEGVCFIALVV